MSRRSVLRAGTLGAAAVGAVGAFPGVIGDLAGSGPELSGTAADAGADGADLQGLAASELSAPIVAHITDAASGDVSLYVGEREISYRDAALVQRLLRAAH